jgi:hypothetical protein
MWVAWYAVALLSAVACAVHRRSMVHRAEVRKILLQYMPIDDGAVPV